MKQIASPCCGSCEYRYRLKEHKPCNTCEDKSEYSPLNPVNNYEDELLEALIKFQKWHCEEFEKNEGCPFDCIDVENVDCSECVHGELSSYTTLIEKIKGKPWK